MTMKFRGKLNLEPYTIKDENLPVDTTLVFTKSQIVFPSSLKNVIFEDTDLRHGGFYKLDVKDNIEKHHRYYITYRKDIRIGLEVDRINEMKLKWIHGLYPFQKNATAALIIAILSLIMSTILGILKLKGC